MQVLPPALAAMGEYTQFVVYKLVPSRKRIGKTDKFPIDVRDDRVSNAHDPAVWMTFDNASAWAAHLNQQHGTSAYGVGFVFTDNDPFWFFDIDGAYDGQAWSALATQLCQAFAGCAVEVSSSGKGLHIFGSGPLPHHTMKNETHGLELYHRLRFVALTGTNAVGDCRAAARPEILDWLVREFFAPDGMSAPGVLGADLSSRWAEACALGPVAEWRGPEDDDDLVRRMLQSKPASAAFGDGITFADLWHCNVDALAKKWPGSDSSAFGASEADAALFQRLAFWTGKDAARIERLALKSGLVRDKWDRDDYLPRSILGCIDRQRDVLTDKLPNMETGLPHDPMRDPLGPLDGTESELDELLAPGTQDRNGGDYFGTADQRELFNACVYVENQHRILVPGGKLLKESQFNVRFGGRTFTLDAANTKTTSSAFEAFTQNRAYACRIADTFGFMPQHPGGAILQTPGESVANTYWPVHVKRKQGDVGLFYDHLKKVLPDHHDALVLLYFMAAVVQYKGVKFQWAPLIQGVEGNGKTLFSRCVAQAVGRRYSYSPIASDIADKFNDWQVGKIFIAVEDINITHDRADLLEALKPMITNTDQQIQGKGADKYQGMICCNWMINTNHQTGVPITDNSRRYAPLFCAQQQASDLVRDGMDGAYFKRLYHWLNNEGGYAIVADLLHTIPIPDEYNPATHLTRAPRTSSTDRAVAVSRGGLEQEILEAIGQDTPGFCGGWISSIQLGHLLDRAGVRRISHSRRHEILESLGYAYHPDLPGGRVANVVLPDAGKPRLYVKRGSAAEATRGSTSAVALAYSKAQEAKVGAPS